MRFLSLVLTYQKAIVFAMLLFVVSAPLAEAGFGITPPYVRNTSLTRNSTYEQQIILVRGNPDIDLKAEIVIDAPGISDWFEIVEGTTIPLPAGEQKVPMTVRVTVPADAPFRDYGGKIRVRTVTADDSIAEGVVSISLGAQVDISLSVIDREIRDFRIRRISVGDLNEGHKVGWLYFPGKINFTMLMENTGNVPIAPSKVLFRIYDYSGNNLLQETEHIGKIDRVAPYATEEIVAELPTNLPANSYMGRYVIYNGDEIKQEGELSLNILPYGTLQTAGFGFSGLSMAHKISVLLPVFAVVILLLYSLYYIRLRNSIRKSKSR